MALWNQITHCASAIRELVAPTYHPERHYMRGPGPACARREFVGARVSRFWMAQRYRTQRDGLNMWAVVDRLTGLPPRFERIPQTALRRNDEDELAQLLNELDEARPAKGLPERHILK